jgi:hypothetical protein
LFRELNRASRDELTQQRVVYTIAKHEARMKEMDEEKRRLLEDCAAVRADIVATCFLKCLMLLARHLQW